MKQPNDKQTSAYVYCCQAGGRVLRDPGPLDGDPPRAVGFCIRCGTFGWGDRKLLEEPAEKKRQPEQ